MPYSKAKLTRNQEVEATAEQKKFEGFRQLGLATTIPFLMVSGPAVGYFIGNWLDGKFGTDPYLVITFSVLGLVAGMKETIKVIKRIAHEEQDTDNEF